MGTYPDLSLQILHCTSYWQFAYCWWAET